VARNKQDSITASGFNAAKVEQAVHEAAATCSLALHPSTCVKKAAILKAAEQLANSMAVLGRALSTVATPLLCNNPSCSNLDGASEVGLVSKGKSKICAGCCTSRYCSRECQTLHRQLHKHVCRKLAAAAAAQQAAGAT
jgi:ATP-dependent RNA helicase DHX37/DHR1